jgi:hypothetical protein
MGSKRWGQPPMKNTFNTKNTYENILTGINKEERNKNQIPESANMWTSPTTVQ